jgi:predicted molibdopterin-dependent oxidoreductase YjgC
MKSHRDTPTVSITIDARTVAAKEGELLVEAIFREKEIPHICYHSPLMGPIQTCDTCFVEVDGKLVRSCGTKVASAMQVITDSKRAQDVRAEAFDVILGNHMRDRAVVMIKFCMHGRDKNFAMRLFSFLLCNGQC